MRRQCKKITLAALVASFGVISGVGHSAENTTIHLTRAEPIDGRTFEVKSGATYRLFGITVPAPGSVCQDKEGQDYDCGQRSTAALERSAMGLLQCVIIDDAPGDTPDLVRCRDMANRDLAQLQVRAGWARPDHGDGGQLYGFDAMEAQARGNGLWAGRHATGIW